MVIDLPTHDSLVEKIHWPVLLTLVHVALTGAELQASPAGQLIDITVPTGAGVGTM